MDIYEFTESPPAECGSMKSTNFTDSAMTLDIVLSLTHVLYKLIIMKRNI